MPARKPGSSKSPRRSEPAQVVASAGKFVLPRELGCSKGPRRSESAQDVESAGKFMPDRVSGSSQGPRRSESVQAASMAVRLVRARSIRVESRFETCEECTSFNIGGTGSVGHENRASRTNSGGEVGGRSTKPVQEVQELPLHVNR